MMYKIAATMLMIASLGLTACEQPPANSLVGSWKSDKSKTLASMHAMKGIPDETKAYLEKSFFGRLTMNYTEKTYSAVLEGEEDVRPDDYPYRIIEETDDYYIIENELLGTKFNKKLFKDRACYYELTSEWNFREYFCRVND